MVPGDRDYDPAAVGRWHAAVVVAPPEAGQEPPHPAPPQQPGQAGATDRLLPHPGDHTGLQVWPEGGHMGPAGDIDIDIDIVVDIDIGIDIDIVVDIDIYIDICIDSLVDIDI